jgi:hypothetical protein
VEPPRADGTGGRGLPPERRLHLVPDGLAPDRLGVVRDAFAGALASSGDRTPVLFVGSPGEADTVITVRPGTRPVGELIAPDVWYAGDDPAGWVRTTLPAPAEVEPVAGSAPAPGGGTVRLDLTPEQAAEVARCYFLRTGEQLPIPAENAP